MPQTRLGASFRCRDFGGDDASAPINRSTRDHQIPIARATPSRFPRSDTDWLQGDLDRAKEQAALGRSLHPHPAPSSRACPGSRRRLFAAVLMGDGVIERHIIEVC
jgi:hypothetical protein